MHLAAHSQPGDVRVSTPGAAAERECGESDGPSRTETTRQRLLFVLFSHLQMVNFPLTSAYFRSKALAIQIALFFAKPIKQFEKVTLRFSSSYR